MYGCVLNGKPLHKIVLHVWSSVFQSYLNAIHTLAKFSVCICIPKQKKTYKVCVCCILWYKSMSIVWIHFAEVACGRCFAKIAIFNEAFMFACLLNVCPILSLMKSGKKNEGGLLAITSLQPCVCCHFSDHTLPFFYLHRLLFISPSSYPFKPRTVSLSLLRHLFMATARGRAGACWGGVFQHCGLLHACPVFLLAQQAAAISGLCV